MLKRAHEKSCALLKEAQLTVAAIDPEIRSEKVSIYRQRLWRDMRQATEARKNIDPDPYDCMIEYWRPVLGGEPLWSVGFTPEDQFRAPGTPLVFGTHWRGEGARPTKESEAFEMSQTMMRFEGIITWLWRRCGSACEAARQKKLLMETDVARDFVEARRIVSISEDDEGIIGIHTFFTMADRSKNLARYKAGAAPRCSQASRGYLLRDSSKHFSAGGVPPSWPHLTSSPASWSHLFLSRRQECFYGAPPPPSGTDEKRANRDYEGRHVFCKAAHQGCGAVR